MPQAYDLIAEKLRLWLNEIIKLLPNIALAALILVIGIFIAKKLRKFIAKITKNVISNKTLHTLLVSVIYVFLIGIVIFIALSLLHLNKAVSTILAGAGIITLALAFAFQDIASNFMSGIFLSIRKPLHPGDIVKIKDYMGSVEEINLRDTVIKTFSGQMVIIPNKEVLQNPIENYTLLGKRRMDLTVGVSYGDDLKKVKEIALGAIQGIDGLTDDAITIYYEEFGGSSINFVIQIWVKNDGGNFLEVRSEAIIRIKKSFDENDISIPFPITTLDFGIKGGVPLSETHLQLRQQKVEQVENEASK